MVFGLPPAILVKGSSQKLWPYVPPRAAGSNACVVIASGALAADVTSSMYLLRKVLVPSEVVMLKANWLAARGMPLSVKVAVEPDTPVCK